MTRAIHYSILKTVTSFTIQCGTSCLTAGSACHFGIGALMLKRVHHINFVVRDLDAAVRRYEELLGVPVHSLESLDSRGVRLARFRVGETWVILVQPTSDKGAPAEHLRRHGEGFFLISYQVDDVAAAAGEVKDHGGRLLNEVPRQGISDWKLIDLDPSDTFDAQIQLVEAHDE